MRHGQAGYQQARPGVASVKQARPGVASAQARSGFAGVKQSVASARQTSPGTASVSGKGDRVIGASFDGFGRVERETIACQAARSGERETIACQAGRSSDARQVGRSIDACQAKNQLRDQRGTAYGSFEFGWRRLYNSRLYNGRRYRVEGPCHSPTKSNREG